MANHGTPAQQLAAYACSLTFEDLPPAVITRLKAALVDAVACAAHGMSKPWTQHVLAVSRASGSGGPCRLPGVPDVRLHPRAAALVLGVAAHAFELDSLRGGGSGVHPGGTAALPALTAAEAAGASGKATIVALAAAMEVMVRIGKATLHTPEKRGFHAPGLTGPFGAAIAAMHLAGADAVKTTNAIAISGSLASGLLAFAKAPDGGMVKRLRLGRAAEGGLLAAELALQGFEAPSTVLEGPYGLLEAFCLDTRPDYLTDGLGAVWESESVTMKKFPCHIMTHAPLEALAALRAERSFTASEVESIEIRGMERIATHHDIKAPGDIMQAQYSIPFIVALSLFRDVADPANISEDVLADAAVAAMAGRIRLIGDPGAKGWGTEVTVTLADGTRLGRRIDVFPGMAERPFTESELAAKFMRLTTHMPLARRETLLAQLMALETIDDVRSLDLA